MLERVPVSCLAEVKETLLGSSVPIVALFDSDYTLRQSLSFGLKGRFGEMPQESLALLSALKDAGHNVGVVTNQPRSGHQIARFLSHKEYPIFPDALEALLGKEWIFGAGADFLIHKYKARQAASEIAIFLASNAPNVANGLVVIGDRESDYSFAQKLAAAFPDSWSCFFKVPDPPYKRFGRFLP